MLKAHGAQVFQGASNGSVNENDAATKDSKEEEDDLSDDEDGVVFNGDLRCVHGNHFYTSMSSCL